MRMRKALCAAVSTVALAGGTTVVSTGSAAAAYGCSGYAYTNRTPPLELQLYDEGANWCGVAVHMDDAYGTYFWTAVQIQRRDGALSPQDEGDFRYYAGPVRIPKNGPCATIYGWSAQTGQVRAGSC
ncbi:hypothetical protein OG948_38375 (plasmid) [Embleya sp. NBC_00888]|uniref:hypothetical protein n=1 Tax=Embleya sp. NBC_00888 TaxID=2975960 RepID=UPI002F90972E|nr:hypothetical protein OG948_38375 [Embleya sp. NBC_00888]